MSADPVCPFPTNLRGWTRGLEAPEPGLALVDAGPLIMASAGAGLCHP